MKSALLKDSHLESRQSGGVSNIDHQDRLYSIYYSNVTVPDAIWVRIMKRVFAIFPLIAMAFSTVSQIFSIAKNIAAQTSIETYYNRDVEVSSNGHSSTYTCNYGNADNVVIFCPYETMAAFESILALWVSYFVIFISLRLYATAGYATNDLRFYIAIDQYNSHRFNQALVYFGLTLTLLTVIVAFYYMSPQTAWNPSLDTPNLLSLIVFFGINIVSLGRFRKQFVNDTSDVVVLDTEDRDPTAPESEDITDAVVVVRALDMVRDFPDFIPIAHRDVRFWYNVEQVVKPVVIAYMVYLQTGSDLMLRRHGEVEVLRRTMTKLFNLDRIPSQALR